tara:strand:- start:583 stop:801 length:219 start_codon:yes stop_codon:yes gene_type:complete
VASLALGNITVGAFEIELPHFVDVCLFAYEAVLAGVHAIYTVVVLTYFAMKVDVVLRESFSTSVAYESSCIS